MRTKPLFLISIGILNFLHGLMHILQFVQSLFLIGYSMEKHDHEHHSFIEHVLHNPILAFVWAIIGIITLVIGIKDYRHHRKCDHDKSDF